MQFNTIALILLTLAAYQVSASIELYCSTCDLFGCQSGLCNFANGGSVHNYKQCYIGDPALCDDTHIQLDTEKCTKDAAGYPCSSGCCVQYMAMALCLKDELRGACDFQTSMSIWLIVGIVAGGVVVLGGIIGFIVYQKRRKTISSQKQGLNQGVYDRV